MSSKKNIRKVALSTMAASAAVVSVAPVASAAEEKAPFTDVNRDSVPEHYDAIVALTNDGTLSGYKDGSFQPYSNVSRNQVATIFARALDLKAPADIDKALKDIKDVNAKTENAKNIAAVVDAGVFGGDKSGKFNQWSNITREQMASVLVRAFNLDKIEAEKVDINLDKVDKSHQPNVQVLANLGITKETKDFRPLEPISRAAFASMVNRTQEVVEAHKAPEAESVTANTQTTLTVTGSGLKNLKAEDITVENNSVKSVSASEDGKSATVVLDSELTIDEATKVTIAGKIFNVTYSINAKKISVVEATYDDDTKDQYVALNVDGKSLNAQELINAGYTVKFQAYKSKAAGSSDELTKLFESDSTGKLSDKLDQTDFLTEMGETTLPADGLDVYVKVTATKGTEVITSDLGKIKIKNIDLAANAITDVVLTNDKGFEHNSSTLLNGEKAKVSKITVKAGSDEEDLSTGYTLESSNKAVFTVDNDTKEIIAQGTGTATLTVKYGGVTTTKTITVKNGQREISKVSLDKSNLKVGKDQVADSKIYLYDQYGDPMDADVQVKVSDTDIASVVTDDTGATEIDYDKFNIGNDPDNETKIFVKGKKAGSTTLTFRDSAGVKIGTTTLKVDVSENTDLAKYTLSIDNDISDSDVTKVNTATGATLTKEDITENSELDLAAEKYVKIDLKAFNANGFELKSGETDAANYDVQVNPSRAGVIKDYHAANGYLVVEADKLTGSATIVVTNKDNQKVKSEIKLNVVEKGYNANGVTFKSFANPTYAQTINYEDVLTHKKVADGKDPVISGIKLTKETSQPIRLDVNTTKGNLYIDKNANGEYDAGERVVGSLQLTFTGKINGETVPADADAAKALAVDGISVASGDDATLLFKVVDAKGDSVGTKAVEVDF